jgi:membrane-bound serine protease (ClpP class)
MAMPGLLAWLVALQAGGGAMPSSTSATTQSLPGLTSPTSPTRLTRPTGPTSSPAGIAPPLFKSGEGKLYVVVSVDGDMMSHHGTVVLQRGIDFAHKLDAALVVVRINTPGGAVGVMFGMRDALVECPIPTLSFVREAYSAGSLLALATDRIYMHPMAHIGDAIPILMPLGQPTELQGDLKEKALAPLKKEFTTTARYKHHREDLALGMVDLDLEIPGLKKKGQILVLDAPTAVREGLAVKVADSIEDAVANEGLRDGKRVDYQMTTADKLASFLTRPFTTILLIAIAIGGIVIEVKTPGFGLGGIIAIASLFLFFWANWYANLAHWMEILLFLVGVGLLVAELFVPGFGVLGISGIICVLVSIFLAMFRLPPKGFAFNYNRVEFAVRNLAWALGMGVAAMFFVAGAIRHSRLWRRVSLGNEMEARKGFTGVPDLSGLMGREATVLTDLRPVGTIQIGDRRFDARAEGQFLERGTAVRVIGADSAQLVVERQKEGKS